MGVQVPAEAAKAFDELSALWGGAGARLENLSSAAPEYRADIAANLSKIGARFSSDFLGDFYETTANGSSAAEAPESARDLELSMRPPWYTWALLALLAYWLLRGK